MKINGIKKSLIYVLLSASFFSCTAEKGQFAFKYHLDEAYRRIEGDIEFPGNKRIDWIYRFNRSIISSRIGIIILKKEIVWVEVKSRSIMLANDRIVYGTIEDLDEGIYKIMLTDVMNEAEIDEVVFNIYNDDEKG